MEGYRNNTFSIFKQLVPLKKIVGCTEEKIAKIAFFGHILTRLELFKIPEF